jgi:hypothetical protein
MISFEQYVNERVNTTTQRALQRAKSGEEGGSMISTKTKEDPSGSQVRHFVAKALDAAGENGAAAVKAAVDLHSAGVKGAQAAHSTFMSYMKKKDKDKDGDNKKD